MYVCMVYILNKISFFEFRMSNTAPLKEDGTKFYTADPLRCIVCLITISVFHQKRGRRRKLQPRKIDLIYLVLIYYLYSCSRPPVFIGWCECGSIGVESFLARLPLVWEEAVLNLLYDVHSCKKVHPTNLMIT